MSDLFCETGYVKFRLWETQVMGDTGYGTYRLWDIQVMGDTGYGRYVLPNSIYIFCMFMC